MTEDRIEEQHRKFFRYTGWMLLGGGVIFALTGWSFLRASNERPRLRR